MSLVGGQPPEDFDSRKNQRTEATSESSDEPQKKKQKIEGSYSVNNNAVFVDATNRRMSRAAEVQVGPVTEPRAVVPHRDDEINEDLASMDFETSDLDPVVINELQKKEEPENKEEGDNVVRTPTKAQSDGEEDALEPLPAMINDGVKKSVVKLPPAWGLDDAYCSINGSKVYFSALLREYGIVPTETPFVQMDPIAVPWRNMDLDNLTKSIISKFPSLVTASDEDFDGILHQIQMEILSTALQENEIEDINAVLPRLRHAGAWGVVREAILSSVSTTSSEQDLTVKVYASLFEPFLCGLDHKMCTKMPLPPPFGKYIRKPETRAYVATTLQEFIFFLRQDSPARADKDKDLHKDLHKLVQLMRCALRLQTLMLDPNYRGDRNLYCFGILCNGLKFQLLQMCVTLRSPKDYVSPTFRLYIDMDLLDLHFNEKTNNTHAQLTRLFNWLSVIRSYGFYLRRLFNEGKWGLNVAMLKYKTEKKRLAGSRSNVQTQNQRTDSEVNEAVLVAIVQAVEDKRYNVLHESNSSDKKVVAVCTFVGRVRIFAVKIFGVKSQQKSREVEVMNMLGKHPNISEILAATTLKTGELIVVQPYFSLYPDTSLGYKDFCQVFLDIAKGLEYMHERGVIHGDLKPSNMIFNRDCHARIIDFDYSLRIGIDGWNEFAGTAGFRAPETRNKENEITPKIDIWSLAMAMCSSLELLGEEEKDSLKKRDILLQILSSDAFFAPLRLLLEKMVELDPVNRPTARQVREAIELSIQGKDYTHVLKPRPTQVTSDNDNKENKISKMATNRINKSPIKHRAIMRTSLVVASPLKDVSNLELVK